MAEENVYANVPKTTEQNRGSKSSVIKTVAVGFVSAALAAAVVIGIRTVIYMHIRTQPRNMTTITTTMNITTTAYPETSQASTCPVKPSCDEGWELNGTKCYYFSSNKQTWSDSRAKCQSWDGDLVKIESREEQRFVDHKVRGLMVHGDDKFWIGLTDAEEEGEWKWVDNSPLNQSLAFWFENRRQKEPDNWTNDGNIPEGEDCVRMGELSQGFEEKCWFDKHCNHYQRFICEKKTTPTPDCQ